MTNLQFLIYCLGWIFILGMFGAVVIGLIHTVTEYRRHRTISDRYNTRR